MEKRSKLIKTAFETYKTAPLSNWILGLVTGLLITAIIALELALPAISFLTFPLLILPIVFSSTLQHLLFKTKGQLTATSSLKGFAFYFTPVFRSSFRFLFSLVKSILLFLILETGASLVGSMIMQLTSTSYVDAINNMNSIIAQESATIDDLTTAFMAYDGILFKYFVSIIFPCLFSAIIFLIYNTSRAAITIYFQMQHQTINPRFTKYVFGDVLRRKRMDMFLDYMTLNWPLYVLLAVGFGGGTVLGYFWATNLESLWSGLVATMLASGLISGSLLAAFFLPFYFTNQEVLFDKYANEFEISTQNVMKFMLNSIQRNIDLSNEEKERLEKSFSNIPQQEEEKGEDDNKKDPEGS